MRKILLIGGSGFLGRSIYKKLKKIYEINIYDRNKNYDIGENKWSQGEFLDSQYLVDAVKGNDVVINLMRPSTQEIITNAEINSHVALAKTCAENQIKLIFISSVAVYGNQVSGPSKEIFRENPISIYGLNKLITEKIYLISESSKNFDLNILRLSNPLGAEQLLKKNILSTLVEAIKEGNPFPIPENEMVCRDFIEIVNLIIKSPNLPTIINVASGVTYTLTEFVRTVESLLSMRLNTEKFNLPKDQIVESRLNISLLRKIAPWKSYADLDTMLKEIFIELKILKA